VRAARNAQSYQIVTVHLKSLAPRVDQFNAR
jgi:hypothetical protein